MPVTLAPGVTARVFSSGLQHSMAIGNDNQLYVWGDNSFGQLGDGTETNRLTPKVIKLSTNPLSPSGATPVAISAGGLHSLAIGSDGKIYAWGYNNNGQLGDGSKPPGDGSFFFKKSPVVVSFPANVTPLVINAGLSDSFAIGSDGKIYAWGVNSSAQLGDGTTIDRLSPVAISLPAGIGARAVSAGGFHTLAIGSDGKCYGWGSNIYGLQLNNMAEVLVPTALPVALDTTVAQVSGGTYHSMVLGSNGKVYCWGSNQYGQVGDGIVNNGIGVDRFTPYEVPLAPGITGKAISAGGVSSFVIGSDGKVYCWGDNSLGEYGDGTMTTSRTPLTNGVTASAIEAGAYQTLAFTFVAANKPPVAKPDSYQITAPASYSFGVLSNDSDPDGNPLAIQSVTQGTKGTVAISGSTVIYTPATGFGGSDSFTYTIGDGKGGTSTATVTVSKAFAGMLKVWGNNQANQFGDGTITSSKTPINITLAPGVLAVAVSAGNYHSLAIGNNGKVYAWGTNSEGQVGDGTNTTRTTPVPIPLPAGVVATAVSAGTRHSLVIGSDGKIYAWGDNNEGELGDGTTTGRNVPVAVTLEAGVAAVAVDAGVFHSLAIGSNGKVYAWGGNALGQLGDGTFTQRNSPVSIGLTATAITAGSGHSLAIGTDSKLYSWGSNNSGELGDGTGVARNSPGLTALAPTVTVKSIEAGYNFSFATGTNGKLYAWGNNYYGPLGDGTNTNRLSPVEITVAAGVTAASLSANFHSLAIGSNGSVYAWGYNDYGQFGDGTVVSSNKPKAIGLTATVVSAGGTHSMAISAATPANTPPVANPDKYQVTAPNAYTFPVLINDTDADGDTLTLQSVTQGTKGNVAISGSNAIYTPSAAFTGGTDTFTYTISDGNGGTATATVTVTKATGGSIRAWGYNEYGQIGDGSAINRLSPVPVKLPTGVTAITVSGGIAHSLALGSDGKIYGWGYNGDGRLGNGTSADRRTPVPLTLAVGVSATVVNAGFYHSMAIGSDGKVYTWGENSGGQLGDGTTTNRSSPIVAPLPAGVTALAISGGIYHSLALGSDGKIYVWGYNGDGRLGDGTTTNRLSPIAVTLAPGVKATTISANGYHNLALGSDNKVYAWGANAYGQLGDGTTINRMVPVKTSLSATAISAGTIHSLAIGTDGKLYSWGANDKGQLGDGTITNHILPAAITLSAGVNVKSISCGTDHSLAIGSDNKVYTWGSNFAGQVGNGTITNRLSPAAIALSATSVGAGAYHSLAIGTYANSAPVANPDSYQVTVPVACTFPVLGNDSDPDGDMLTIQSVTQGAKGTSAISGSNVIYTPKADFSGSDSFKYTISDGNGGTATATVTITKAFAGTLRVWGINHHNQLGDGTTTNRLTPTKITLAPGVLAIAVSGGHYHSLAIGNDGKLYAWGTNSEGQVGDGTNTNRSSPVPITLAAGVVASSISAGANHSLALGNDGKLYAWGDNTYGQLGDGTTTNRNLPMVVTLEAGVTPVAFSAGDSHSLAIGNNGKVYSWGDNTYGQLGDGTLIQRNSPVSIGLAATSVTTGSQHSLAIGSDGKLYSWGDNSSGQLGDGTTNTRKSPALSALASTITVKSIEAGYKHSSAVATDGKLYAWGSNSNGNVGDGTTTNRLTPVEITLAPGAMASAVSSYYHSLAISNNGSVYAWANNDSGQLGDGTTTKRLSPIIIGLTATVISTGAAHSLAISADVNTPPVAKPDSYEVTAPVAYTFPVLGNDSDPDGDTLTIQSVTQGAKGSVSISGSNAIYTPSANFTAGSDSFTYTISDGNGGTATATVTVTKAFAGSLKAWGDNGAGDLGDGTSIQRNSPVPIKLAPNVLTVTASAGYTYSLAIGSDGKLYSWGENTLGQLGDGTTTNHRTPMPITLATGVVPTSISAGAYHALAIGSDGKLYAWGENTLGQLGDGTTTNRKSPVVVTLGTGVVPVAISASTRFSVALGSNGKVYAWGTNTFGQLGDGTITQRNSPVAIGLSASAVEAGDRHVLAIGLDGKLYAWGNNVVGALGDGTTANRLTPVTVTLAAGVTAKKIKAGGNYSMAVGSDNKLYAWGYNEHGQVGDGTFTNRANPVAITLTPGVTPKAITAGNIHAMAIGSDDRVYSWGINYAGQLGNGTSIFKVASPTAIALTAKLINGGSNHSLAIGDYAFTAPVANPDSYQVTAPVAYTFPVLNNDSDPDGDTLTIQSVTQGTKGSVSISGSNVIYTPTAGFASGTDSFTYTISDGNGGTATATVTVTKIAAGTLRAWGDNSTGQLGDGTTTNRKSPITVNLAPGVLTLAMSGGEQHTLAIGSDGNVYAWGYNGQGQLGDGTTTQRNAPIVINLAANVKAAAVSAGLYHSLAIGSDGKLYAWGENSLGQLGDGTSTNRKLPVVISLEGGVAPVAISAGNRFSLAIGSNGKVYAWGTNALGQLGNGTTTQRNSPVAIAITASAIEAGDQHSLAIGIDGKLYAWGANNNGQLGDGTTTNRPSPIGVKLPAGVTAKKMGAGLRHSMAIGSDNKLYAWGSNATAQLGDGTTTNRLSPVGVTLAAGVTPTSISAGVSHSLAIGSDKKVYSWGFNPYGQLGNGTINVTVMSPVAIGVTATAIEAGGSDSFAIGDLVNTPPIANPDSYQITAPITYTFAVLENDSDANGDTLTIQSVTQGTKGTVSIVGSKVSYKTKSSFKNGTDSFTYTINDGNGHTATATVEITKPATSKLRTWGSNSDGQLGNNTKKNKLAPSAVTLADGVSPTAISGGSKHSLAIGNDGKLYAWGSNSKGQLGNGTTTTRLKSIRITLAANVLPTAVSAGGAHSLAIGNDGKLYAWGYNRNGQLGDGTGTMRKSPVVVTLAVGVSPIAISASGSHSLAIGNDGKLYAWGYNRNGQLGDGTKTDRRKPVVINLPVGVTAKAISAGHRHSLALGTNGKVYSWGSNSFGQLGNGTKLDRSSPAIVNLSPGVPITAISAGGDHSFALGSDYYLDAWGDNSFGQLGDGTKTTRLSPVNVKLAPNMLATAVDAGFAHTLAIGLDGRVYSWGYNGFGQLGTDNTTDSPSPYGPSFQATIISAGSFHSLAIP